MIIEPFDETNEPVLDLARIRILERLETAVFHLVDCLDSIDNGLGYTFAAEQRKNVDDIMEELYYHDIIGNINE